RRAEREADASSDVALFHPLRPRERRELVADDRAVAEHARELGDVRGGPEETRVPAASAHGEGVLVVHLPAEAPLAPLGVLLRRDAALGRTWTEVRGRRLDRSEHDLADQVRV